MSIPYVYLIGWSTLNKWYIGSQYSKKADPSNLWTKYFTSSKHVKHFSEENGPPDVLRILKTFDCPIKAKNYEDKLLRRLKVNLDTKWLNIKADSFRNLDVSKIRYRMGEENPIHQLLSTPEGREEFSRKTSIGTKLGHAKSSKFQEAKIKNRERLLSDKNPGKNKTEITKQRLSEAQKIRFSKDENKKFGADNHMFGRTHTPEAKQSISEHSKKLRAKENYVCCVCGRPIKQSRNIRSHLKTRHNIIDETTLTEFVKDSFVQEPDAIKIQSTDSPLSLFLDQ